MGTRRMSTRTTQARQGNGGKALVGCAMSSLHPVHPDFLKAAMPSGYLRYKQFLGQQGKIRNSLIFQIGMGISQPFVSKVLRNWPHSVGFWHLSGFAARHRGICEDFRCDADSVYSAPLGGERWDISPSSAKSLHKLSRNSIRSYEESC